MTIVLFMVMGLYPLTEKQSACQEPSGPACATECVFWVSSGLASQSGPVPARAGVPVWNDAPSSGDPMLRCSKAQKLRGPNAQRLRRDAA